MCEYTQIKGTYLHYIYMCIYIYTMVIYIYVCVCMCKCIFDDFRDSGRQATYSYQISSLSACGPSAGLVGHR